MTDVHHFRFSLGYDNICAGHEIDIFGQIKQLMNQNAQVDCQITNAKVHSGIEKRNASPTCAKNVIFSDMLIVILYILFCLK